jgi:hypothetical protein
MEELLVMFGETSLTFYVEYLSEIITWKTKDMVGDELNMEIK